MNFILRVIRNGAILAALMFVSIWAGIDILEWEIIKPVVIFFVGYILTELARYYHISYPAATTKGKTICPSTLVF